MYTLSLEIINKCNLNCTYCYLGEKKNTYMSLETAQKAIDIAVHEANKQHDRTLMVYFIGGEPLMAFNLMKGGRLCEEKMPGNKLNMQVQYYDKWNVSYG